MLGLIRRYLDSWVAKVFFFLLVGMFVVWGIGTGLNDTIQTMFYGDANSAATVYGRNIAITDVQQLYGRQLQQLSQMLGGHADPTPEMRKGVAAQALQQLITETALNAAVANMGIAAPDDAVRQAVYSVPQFLTNGQFDRAKFQALLQNNNLTEAKFLDLMRTSLAQSQLLEAVRAGVVSPDVLTREVFAFQGEKRVADIIELPFSAAPAPPAPTQAQLDRWYENHPAQYSSPEYRRIKAVVLSPETVGKDIPVSDDELKAVYDQHRGEFNQPEKRSVEVLLAPNQEAATELAATWGSGADWASMQKQPGASPVELTDATPAEFPDPDLANAVFAAPEGQVSAPVQSALGWHVFKVTKVTPGNSRTEAQMKDQLRAEVVAGKAADLIDDRANKIEDLLAAGTPLDQLPGDLGLGAATGTLDAQGMTQAATPAPIPGSDALRAALVAAAFQMKPGDPPRLQEGPQEPGGGQGYFAVIVDAITPPAVKPEADVAEAVAADWTHDAVRHAQEATAAGILTAVKGGTPLAEAAPGLAVKRLPPAGRATGAPGMPDQLVEPLFTLKKGEPTMVETPDRFTVAVLAEVQEPDPKADAAGYGQAREALTKAVGDDVQSVLTVALRDRGSPKVNTTVLNSITQAPQ